MPDARSDRQLMQAIAAATRRPSSARPPHGRRLLRLLATLLARPARRPKTRAGDGSRRLGDAASGAEARARGVAVVIARHALQRDRRKESGEPTELEPLDTLAGAGWGQAGARASLEAALAGSPRGQRALGALDSAGGGVWFGRWRRFSIREAAEALGSRPGDQESAAWRGCAFVAR